MCKSCSGSRVRTLRGLCLPLRAALTIGMLLAAGLRPLDAYADADPDRFDGLWDTVLSCTNSNGALGYSFRFPATIRHGVLHAEKGDQGKPGWLQVDGKVLPDGSADLYASGLVGAAPYAVGQRPAGSEYGYHIETRFNGATAEGHRVEGRPCTVTFTKTKPAGGDTKGAGAT